MQEPSSTQNRVVYFIPNWFGDGIMAWGAISKKILDSLEFQHTIIVKKRVAALWRFLLSALPVQVQLIEYEDSFLNMRKLVSAIRKTAPQEVYLLTETPRNFVIASLLGASIRIGFSRGLSRLFLTEAITKISTNHRASEYARVLHHASPESHLFGPLPNLVPLPATVEAQVTQKMVALFPGAARGPSKRWPYFAALADKLASQGITPVIFGSNADAEVAALITTGVNLCGSLTIEEMATVLQRCSYAISNDSGGMHFADLVGVPLIAIFGLTDPSVTGPRRSSSTVIKAKGRGSTRIGHTDEEAQRALASIDVEQVITDLKLVAP